MGVDKAFLQYKGHSFVSLITEEMSKVSADVILSIGNKKREKFESVLNPSILITNDVYNLDNPMGGILSAIPLARNSYAAIIACDTPLIKSEVIKLLYGSALGHSAAVPVWENNNIEPLCAVYDLVETSKAAREALKLRKIGPRNIISLLPDVSYVKVSEIRKHDPGLLSLFNVNSQEDFLALEQYKKLEPR